MTASVSGSELVTVPPAPTAGALATRDAYARATRVIACVVVVAVGSEERFGYGATAAVPLAIVLVPLWLPALRHYAHATLITCLAAMAAVSGIILSELSSVDHVVSAPNRIQAIGLLASGIAAFALLLWAGSLLPLHRIAMLYGVGALGSAIANGELSWKYNLAVPTTFVVLGVLERRRAGLVPAIALLALGVLGVADEARSYFAVCVVAATITIWQLRPGSEVRQPSAWDRWFPMILLAGIALAVYFFITSLATSGALGETLEERSNTQIQSSGSLIAGGRPEWGATTALVELHPAGYGAGVVPNWADRTTGKAGLESVGIEVDPLRDEYMFGQTFELHSVAPDLWVRFGWVGVALAVAIVVIIVKNLSFLIAARRAPTYVVFSCILAVWYMLFGPMYSNWVDVCVALALVTLAVGPRPDTPAVDRATR
jgi:hypothetical protein